MFAHAEYHSTYPLPICGTIHFARTIIDPEKVNASNARKVSFSTDKIEDFETAQRFVERSKSQPPKANAADRYIPLLSLKKWTSTSDIADALCCRHETVNKFPGSHKDLFVKSQRMSKQGYRSNFWKLRNTRNNATSN